MTIEPNPAPIYICLTCQGRISRREASVLCPYGGWVYLKCTTLLSVDEWNSDFVCHRCSWCCPEVAAEENSSSDNEEAHDLTEALALAAGPPQIGVTSNEMSTAKQRRRKRNREARRARRRDKREQAWRERAEREGKRRSTTIWTCKLPKPRVAFPFTGRFTEILRTKGKSRRKS